MKRLVLITCATATAGVLAAAGSTVASAATRSVANGAATAQAIYAIDPVNHTIIRESLSGGARKVLLSNIGDRSYGLVVDSSHNVYFNTGPVNVSSTSVVKIPAGGSKPAPFAADLKGEVVGADHFGNVFIKRDQPDDEGIELIKIAANGTRTKIPDASVYGIAYSVYASGNVSEVSVTDDEYGRHHRHPCIGDCIRPARAQWRVRLRLQAPAQRACCISSATRRLLARVQTPGRGWPPGPVPRRSSVITRQTRPLRPLPVETSISPSPLASVHRRPRVHHRPAR